MNKRRNIILGEHNIAQFQAELDAQDGESFDMDATLIKSEPTNQGQSCVMLTQFLVGKRQLPTYSPVLPTRWIQGRSVVEEAIRFCNELNLAPLTKLEEEQLFEATEARIAQALRDDRVQATPGAADYLAKLFAKGRLMAVASSSGPERVNAGLEGAGLGELFPLRLRCSALALPCGEARLKPEPDVFLLAAQRMGLNPKRCAAFDDSPGGIIAADRAEYGLLVGYTGGTPKEDQVRQTELLLQTGVDYILPHWSLLANAQQAVSIH